MNSFSYLTIQTFTHKNTYNPPKNHNKLNSQNLRKEIQYLMSHHPTGSFRDRIAILLQEYATRAPNVNRKDILFVAGDEIFGVKVEFPPQTEAEVAAEEKENKNDPDHHHCHKYVDAPILGFEYMRQFMKDVFLAYGVTPERAEICGDVLIEADKRGIDSHGLGRLKPIYCDRIDQGILWPDRPITILKETETTALVDGNLGLGLYIGPYCMQLAIDKAKKYGVGFVACQNSTHYGIAGTSRKIH